MNNKDNFTIKGKYRIRDAKTGEILFETKNLVVNTGLNLTLTQLAGTTSTPITHIAVGTSNIAATVSDTTLNTELYRKAVTVSVENNILTASATFGLAEANDSWYELGMLTASSGGVMFSHANIVFQKLSDVAVTVEYISTLTNN